MKKIILYILIISPILLIAQAKFSLTGKIIGGTGQPLGFVDVVLNKNNKYATSNESGYYEIKKIIKGEYTVIVSSLGFQTIVKKISVNKNLSLNFKLKEESESLDNITITTKKAATQQKEKGITISSFNLADIAASTNVITDQIDKISGVRIRRSGEVGGNSDISINGLSGTAIRLYIDGIPLEFLYPGLDLANVPLSKVKRVDVYKGVVPVDIGTDALGGAINIITGVPKENRVKASYTTGSFNTHLSDVNLTLVDDNENFFNVTGGINYSDNDYTFKANVLVNNPFAAEGAPPLKFEDQNIRRFNNRYRQVTSSTTVGTFNKKWTDHTQLTFTYIDRFGQIQNGVRIVDLAFGEAFGEAENFSTVLKYDKTLLKDKIKLKTISSYSVGNERVVDTTSNAYNWLGNIFTKNAAGEVRNGSPSIIKNEFKNYANRLTFDYQLNDFNKLVLSNLIASKERDVTDFNVDNLDEFDLIPTQKETKDVLGLEFETKNFDKKLTLTVAGKYYNFQLSTFDDRSESVIKLKDGFFGGYGSFKYKITPELAVRGSYERGFLIPEINQFAGNSLGTIRRNSEIKPEESDNYNFGFLYSKNFNDEYKVFLSANAFLRRQTNIIFLNVSRDPGQYVNAEEAETKGIETELKVKFLKNFNWEANISYLEKTFISFENPLEQFQEGSNVPNTPNFFYNTKLSWSKDNVFNSKVDVSLYGAYTFIDGFNFRAVGAEQTIDNTDDAFVDDSKRLDAGISLQFLDKKITAAFNINNISNEELFDNFSIPKPGRNYNFKLIYELSNF